MLNWAFNLNRVKTIRNHPLTYESFNKYFHRLLKVEKTLKAFLDIING